MFIGIAGMIGAGKSTLAAALGQHLGIEYLADFYRDTARHSFAMQVYLLRPDVLSREALRAAISSVPRATGPIGGTQWCRRTAPRRRARRRCAAAGCTWRSDPSARPSRS
ncbi:MAG: deoxynucleoside kinase [Myxococcales bacterium]|nr:deoxynucleoside kinase [Myxococcales bacterium]